MHASLRVEVGRGGCGWGRGGEGYSGPEDQPAWPLADLEIVQQRSGRKQEAHS